MRSEKYLTAISAYEESRIEDAFRIMEDCATEGDPIACFTLALWCKDTGKTQDVEYWLQQLESMALNGDAAAQWELGQNYRYANLFSLDVSRANYWLEQAAENGNGDAQYHLGWFYETGQYDYPINKNLSNKWYQAALEQEHPEALYRTALMLFENGKPTKQALELLKKAAAKGMKQAEYLYQSHTC